MASNSTATSKQITVRIVVDTEENRVLYAEAGKDFVDVLLSFLTLPLGTIARLVDKDSNMKPLRLGCISSLYRSVGNLDPKYWNSETCKQMLLQPRNSMERINQKLILNIDDTEPTKFYACEMSHCRRESNMLVSTFNNIKCKCGKNLTHVLDEDVIEDDPGEGYVQEASFVVFDDLHVVPLNLTSTLCLLKTLRSKDKIEDFAVNIDPKEVMDLLRCSLVSSTVLTDSLLRRKQIIENPKGTAFKNTSDIPGGEDIRLKLNIMIEKSKFKVLFAIVDEDFMEQLLSFLAIPLGAVERVLQGNSGLGCIDRLYNSLTSFESTDFISGNNMLADLKFAPQYKLKKQMLPISEVMYPSPLYLCYVDARNPRSTCFLADKSIIDDFGTIDILSLAVNLWDPKHSSTTKSSYGYVKRQTVFMVADDLTVKPFSSDLVVSCLNKEANSKVSEHDLEERTICIGVQEVVNILKASLISTSALTMGLAQFLTNEESRRPRIALRASNSTASNEILEQIALRVAGDREKNRVLYAEAKKDFVDVLLSFLTIPLGTIARLVSQDSNMKPCRFGCISSVYESLGNLDPKYLNSETSKQMLLRPRNSMELYNQEVRLNIDDTEPTMFYGCEYCIFKGDPSGSLVSISKNINYCNICGADLTFVLMPCKSLLYSPLVSGSTQNATSGAGDDAWEGYAKETASFIISDDLNVTPADFNTTLCLIKNLCSEDPPPEESTMVLGSNEILDLLKCLLVSKSALTDSMLRKEHSFVGSETSFMVPEKQGREITRTMKMKILMTKSKSKILFAQVEEDFIDQLLSFLTFPLGAVERVLDGHSGLVCVDKLYNSLTNFDSIRDFNSEKIKNLLANLKVAPYYKVNNQMLPIDELKYPPELSCCYNQLDCLYYLTADASLYSQQSKGGVRMCDPKSTNNGYAKSRTKFMVADDLSVKPLSSHQVLSSLLTELKVPYHDLEQRTICIGVQEVLSILKSSLVSTSALTIGLKGFLSNITEGNKSSNTISEER